MLDPVKFAEMQTLLREGKSTKDPLGKLSHKELRKLRGDIDALLPNVGVSSLNLESELIEQYHKTKGLMDETLADSECPANQKSQVCNAVVTILAQLVKIQEDLQKQESLKIMETLLIDSLKYLPEDEKTKFFDEYERMARKSGML
jgi:hypothetical protein